MNPQPTRGPMSSRGVIAAWGLIAVSAGAMGVNLVASDGPVRDWTYLVVVVGAGIAAVFGARRSPLASVARLIAIGLVLSACADVVWQALLWKRGVAPDVSLADGLWLAGYIAIGAALLRAPHGGRRLDRHGVVDIAVVVLVVMLVQWELAFDEIVTDSTVPPMVRFVWALYPAFDAVLVALAVRAVTSHRVKGWPAIFMAGGAACWLLSDFGYTLFAVDDAFGVWLNVGWMVGALLLAVATLQPNAPEAPVAAASAGTETVRHSGIAIALVPLLVPGAIAIANDLRGEASNPILLYSVSVVLLALAFTRGAQLLRAEAEARDAVRSQQRYAQAVAMNSSDAVAVVDRNGVILHDAPKLAALVGHAGRTTLDGDAFELVSSLDLDDARAMFDRCVTSHGQTFESEVRVQHQRGHQLWLGVRMVNLIDDPDVGGVVLNLHDITDRKKAEDDLSHQAFHDGLTDLANRALFHDRVEHSLRRNERTGLDTAVIFLDLDGFKTVNDGLGHSAGDQLLQEVAARLCQAVRNSDTVARLGGDEFAILIEQSPAAVEESEGVAERILRSLATSVELEGQAVTVSASIGIATSDPDSSATSLLRDADVAMYRAKASGKARWVVYDPVMRSAAMERLQLENDLIGALDGNQFALVYQPVVRLDTEEIVGFEALLRWHHPTLGLIAPDRFIPIAEETGLIVPIGRWVLSEACATAARWSRNYPGHRGMTMAVNVSGRQIASSDLVSHVEMTLAESRIDPASLVLEITETALIQDTSVAAVRLQQLSSLGVRLAIDDFGTGYSSLSYLRQFPVDILKIDRSFISAITDREQVPAIVSGLLDLGRTLDLETVAEGVELDVQRDQLRSENCDLAQGFLFSRPLEPVDVELLLMQLGPGLRTAGDERPDL